METVLTKQHNGVDHIVARYPSYTLGATALHRAMHHEPESKPYLYSAAQAEHMGLPVAPCIGDLQPGGRYGLYPCPCTFN